MTQRKTLRQGVARPDLLKHTLETVMGNRKKIGDFTGAEVAELACLAEPDFHVLADIAKLMADDGLDWATAVCVTLAKLAECEPVTSAEPKPQH